MIRYKDHVYIVSALVFFGLLVNVVFRFPDVVEEVSAYPEMSYEQLVAEHNFLAGAVKKPLSGPEEFYDIVDRLYAIEFAAKRFERTHDQLDPRYPSIARQIEGGLVFLRAENEARQRRFMYGRNLSVEEKYALGREFERVDKGRDRTLFHKVINRPIDPISLEKFYHAAFVFHFGFMPLVFLIYWVRVDDEGGSIIHEVGGNPLFPIWVLFWQVGLFKFKGTSLRKQIRRTLRYASLTLSTVLSFGAATLKAQTKKHEDEGQSGNGHTLVISGSSHYLSKYLGLDGAVFHKNPVLQSSLTIAHMSGAYVGFWKSVALTDFRANPNFGREEDYTLGFSRKVGKGVLDASATYFNVTPLGKMREGDLLQTSVMASGYLPIKIPNYVWVRRVAPLKDGLPPGGWFVHVGAAKESKLARKARLTIGAEAVFDSGAFGFNPSGLLRGNATLKVPFKNLTFELPTFRWGVPFTRPRDGRKFEQVIGIGLSFSFAH